MLILYKKIVEILRQSIADLNLFNIFYSIRSVKQLRNVKVLIYALLTSN